MEERLFPFSLRLQLLALTLAAPSLHPKKQNSLHTRKGKIPLSSGSPDYLQEMFLVIQNQVLKMRSLG